VTGTRLENLAAAGAWPLTVLNREELQRTGLQQLGEILQRLPEMGGLVLNTRTSQRGAGGGLSRGIETVALRGLGATRTLVLVDGRRFVPGGNGAGGLVDLATVPLAMVERVEVFKSGASVEYGADAVAGVVNIILRKRFSGLQVGASGRIAARGDGESGGVHLLWGGQWDRSGWLLGLELRDQAPLGKGERRFSRVRQTVAGPDNERLFNGSSAPPNGNFRTSTGRLTRIEDRSGRAPEDFRPFVASGPNSDGYNFNPLEDLIQAGRRVGLFSRGHWTINRAVSVDAEVFYHRRQSSQRLAPLPLFTSREDGVVVAADNWYNPFGEELTDARRRLVEAGPREFSQDNRIWHLRLGASGELAGWQWDAGVVHGRNRTDQRASGNLLDDRLAQALGPSFLDSDGRVVCGRPGQVIAGCVPLNLFAGPGSITPAMLAYVGTDLHDAGFNRQTVVGLEARGQAGKLPAGPAELAFGLEWRRERGADRPDRQTQAGNTTGRARAPTAGGFDRREAFGEVGIPLLDGLLLDLGGRWIDDSNFGGDGVFEVGLFWQPSAHWSARISLADALRAPNIAELFGGQSQSNPIVRDPCADFSALPDLQVQRCVDQGVPADGSFTQNGDEIPELAGGNPDLRPEQAAIRSYGLNWLPWGDERLRLGLDYYDVRIRNGVGALGANSLLEQCLATGAPEFCQAIERRPDGSINQVFAQLRNLAHEQARGLDFTLASRHDLAGGRLRHGMTLSRLLERRLIAFPGAESLFGVGEFDPDNFGTVPRWRGQWRLGYDRGQWSLGYRASWIDAVLEKGGAVFPGTVRRAGSVLYHDLDFVWRGRSGFDLSAGIDNLTDVAPPFMANADEANTDLATYRVAGTTFWLRLAWNRFD